MKNQSLFLMLSLFLASCSGGHTVKNDTPASITVKNSTNLPQTDALITLNAKTLKEKYPELDLSAIKINAERELTNRQ